MDSPTPAPGALRTTPLVIGIAVVLRDGGSRILIRQRPLVHGSPMPGIWEFPGGKTDPGEDPSQTAVRECLEESGLAVTIPDATLSDQEFPAPLHRVFHQYPHGPVDLHYYECRCLDDPDSFDPASGFRWIPVADLNNYRFPSANEAIIEKLQAQARG